MSQIAITLDWRDGRTATVHTAGEGSYRGIIRRIQYKHWFHQWTIINEGTRVVLDFSATGKLLSKGDSTFDITHLSYSPRIS